MCTADAEGFITHVVDQLINSDALFTAFDVSKKVQSLLVENKLPNERHRELKRRIHEEVDPYVSQGLYKQELHDVGADVKAFLYFPSGSDPSTYVPQPRNDGTKQTQVKVQSTPQVASPVAASVVTAVGPPGSGLSISLTLDNDDGDEVDKAGRDTDKRGSLSVPAFLLRAAGFSTGDIAYVTPTNPGKSFSVSKRPIAGIAPLKTTYTINSSVNARITASTLSSCGVTPLNKFDFEFDRNSDQVVIKVHDED